MRVIILSALFAVGFALASMGGASASPIGNGINNAAPAASLIEEAQYRRCRVIRVCRFGPYGGRRCHLERICRHW